MKQSEKNQKSRALILTHAFTEFASHGYEGSSLNQICARGNLSKGLLYHYYKNTDALYLSCVHVLFDDMTRYLRSELNLSTVTVEQYFTVRMRFFRQHPLHLSLIHILSDSHRAVMIASRETMCPCCSSSRRRMRYSLRLSGILTSPCSRASSSVFRKAWPQGSRLAGAEKS